MVTYQKQNFLSLLERFEKIQVDKTRQKEEKDNEWRKAFIAKYPRDSIISMQMNNYLISPKSFCNSDSFCGRICSDLKTVFHINVSDKERQNTFGIILKYGTQLTLSKDLESKFGSDYDSAFTYIKNEIITLLDEVDRNNYAAIESCELSYIIKYILLIIYCPEKILPVCSRDLLLRYCETIGLTRDDYKEMVYYSNLLIQWKKDVPEISGWSYSKFTSFCDWLWTNGKTIEGNSLRSNANISINEITNEINDLGLQGQSKEAVIKVRVNQGIFRDILLQCFNSCCLCDVSNQNLLIASHIKPWSVCRPEEKLDRDNGFLLCPNHDRLFDQGWITFADDGKIIIADGLLESDRIALNVRDNMSISLTDKNREYLQYHRKHIFNKRYFKYIGKHN